MKQILTVIFGLCAIVIYFFGAIGAVSILAFFVNSSRGASPSLLFFGILFVSLSVLFYLKGDNALAAIVGSDSKKAWQEPPPSQEKHREQNANTGAAHHKQPPPNEKERENSPSNTQNSTEINYARILGLTGKVTMKQVRRAYLKRISEYHPDKVSHMGNKIREIAEQESRLINEAYSYFEERYANSKS